MSTSEIIFNDGDAYEKMMGVWSRSAGEKFLDWLDLPKDLNWVDVGCGSGAFSELLVDQCEPKSIEGVDPSEAQLEYARTRHTAGLARFSVASGDQLPFEKEQFDAAVMALVIFFLPDPQAGVKEMYRVLRSGGTACAYAWDILGGGMPHQAVRDELLAIGQPVGMPPSVEAAELDQLGRLWTDAGFDSVLTTRIDVQRTFKNFEEFWHISLLSPAIGPHIDKLTPQEVQQLKQNLESKMKPDDASGKITCHAHAHAVTGIKS